MLFWGSKGKPLEEKSSNYFCLLLQSRIGEELKKYIYISIDVSSAMVLRVKLNSLMNRVCLSNTKRGFANKRQCTLRDRKVGAEKFDLATVGRVDFINGA